LQKPDDGSLYSYVLNLTAYGDRLTLARNLERWSEYDLPALRMGPLCLVFLPEEPFIELALEIRERSESEFTFVAGYTDATPVYVPDETGRHGIYFGSFSLSRSASRTASSRAVPSRCVGTSQPPSSDSFQA